MANSDISGYLDFAFTHSEISIDNFFRYSKVNHLCKSKLDINSPIPGLFVLRERSSRSSIRKLKDILPQSKLEQVYRALVESHLRYGNELWGSLSDTKLNHLQRLQDRARTLIESSNVKDGWRCNWLSVSNLIKYDKAVMAYKIMNNLCPNSLQGKFTMRSQISAYVTRNCRDIDIPKRNLEFSKKSFLYSGAKLWNDIPLDIRNSPTVLTFKKKLKDYLLH